MGSSALEDFDSKLEEWKWAPICESHLDYDCLCVKPFFDRNKLEEWMVEKKGEDAGSKTNTEHILEELKGKMIEPPLDHDPKTIFEGRKKCVLVFIILLSFKHGHLIYLFRSAGVNDESIENSTSGDTPDPNNSSLEPQRLRKSSLNYFNIYKKLSNYLTTGSPKDILNSFEEKRWAFLTPTFSELGIDKKFIKQIKLPFCRLKKPKEAGTASVFRGVVPESFVCQKLKEGLGKPYDDDDFQNCYELAIKRFHKGRGNDELYRDEVGAFNAFLGQPGMVQILGCYEHFDLYQSQPTYNIILESGEMDLMDYFLQETPPEQPVEIFNFWKSIFEVANAIEKFHHFRYDDNTNYYGWHADVKAENIILFREKFKLSDFGFSVFQKDEKGEGKQGEPKKSLRFRISVYSAPELAEPNLSNPKKSVPVSQKIDTWSFGCVLLLAVTWIVLGSEGIETYRLLTSNKFHDGRDVLPEIGVWHDYLNKVKRASDDFTPRLITLIDKHLLVKEKFRKSSKELCVELQEILEQLRDSSSSFHIDDRVKEALKKRKGIECQKRESKSWLPVSSQRSSVDFHYDRNRESVLRRTLDQDAISVPSHPNRNVEIPKASEILPVSTSSATEGPTPSANATSNDDYQPSLHSLPSYDTNTNTTTMAIPLRSQDTQPFQDQYLQDHDIWKMAQEKDQFNTFAGTWQDTIRKNPDVQTLTERGGLTPIMVAARSNNIPMVDLLLDNGSPIPNRDNDGRTLLHWAIIAFTSGPKETPEFIAVLKKMIEKSLDAGFFVNILDNYQRSALYYCIQHTRVKSAKLLLAHGAWIKPPEGSRGEDLLKIAIMDDNTALVKIFIKAEGDDFQWSRICDAADKKDLRLSTSMKAYLNILSKSVEEKSEPKNIKNFFKR